MSGSPCSGRRRAGSSDGASPGSSPGRPAAEPAFEAILVGARRPPWTPHADPRLEALAAGYALLLDADGTAAAHVREVSS